MLEHLEFLKSQLDQTQRWLENESEVRSANVVSMIIKGMIETERQIEEMEGRA